MSLVVGDNSYFTVTEADTIVANSFLSTSTEATKWNSLSDSDKAIVITNTTAKIESSFTFIGRKQNVDKQLAFPRYINNSLIESPTNYNEIIMTQAIRDLVVNSSEEASLKMSGIKSYSVEGASITFDTSADNALVNKSGIWTDLAKRLNSCIY